MSRITSAFIALDHAAPEPLYRQLYQCLRDAILTAQSPPWTPIPSSRELARALGIARNTVLTAIEQLRAEGSLQGERGSGTYVNDVLPEDLSRARAIAGPSGQACSNQWC
jgi:GntR family transcriptional regulator/MocR family aminotransferase